MTNADLVEDVIRRIAVGPDRGKDISADEAERVMKAVLNTELDPIQVGIFLIALRMKRESVQEFQGIFSALQSSITERQLPISDLYCLADPYDGYLRNIPATPFVPAVLAACGMPALICGVHSVGPKHGITAHKVFKLAGINCRRSTAEAAAVIEAGGWCYLDQAQYASQLNALNEFRDTIVKRTAITTLERLLMPIKAENTHLVLGYVHKAYPEIYSTIASFAGYSSAMLTKGVEGGFVPALNKPMRSFMFDFMSDSKRNTNEVTEKAINEIPNELTSKSAAPIADEDSIKAVRQCLDMGLESLAGKANPLRNSIVVASAQIISAYDQQLSFTLAVEKVQNCLDNGSAQARFQSLIEGET